MLKVELVRYEDLTEEEQEEQPNRGVGKESANYIKLSDCGKTLAIISDAAEPEDATFDRDLNVTHVIELAYKVGIKHGKKLKR